MEQIITSITDTDLYKFTTMYYAWARQTTAHGRLTFKCRTPDVNLTTLLPEVKEQLAALRNVQMTAKEIDFLALQGGPGGSLFSAEFLRHLEMFRFDNRVQLNVEAVENELKIEVQGTWSDITLWEIPVLAIVNELYMNSLSCCSGACSNHEGMTLLGQKIDLLKTAPDAFSWTEFGTRRRFSKAWQKDVVTLFLRNNSKLSGTSNVALAMEFGLPCVGTMPHEYLQAHQAFGKLPDFQYRALLDWITFYKGNLGIALSDVVGMDAFLRDFDFLLAKSYDGARHDSGNPYDWCEKLLEHYRALGIDSKTKRAVWSDGLTFRKAINLYHYYSDQIQCSFGIGTNVTNDVGLRPLNIVMKLTQVNGQPVAKLSDAPGKTMCDDPIYLAELRRAQEIQS